MLLLLLLVVGHKSIVGDVLMGSRLVYLGALMKNYEFMLRVLGLLALALALVLLLHLHLHTIHIYDATWPEFTN